MSVCLFLGPTLPVAEVGGTIEARVLPPVGLGDVHRAVTRFQPRAIGIVDGYFQWAPAVWHKEILWAIGQGVHVFGAASMGALRAAELAPFGMRGVGRIFEAYRDGWLDGAPFEDDDEVAVVHGPPESGYLGGSEAMVNIRFTLARAVREGVIGAATGEALAGRAKATFFPDRSFGGLLEAEGLPAGEMAALARWLPGGRVDRKRLDAREMLVAMRDFLAADPPPAEAGFAFERTTYWDRAEAAFEAAAQPHPLLAALRLQAGRCERLDEGGLRDWYFARVAGRAVPEDMAGWLREAGFADLDDFHRAAFAAYLGGQDEGAPVEALP